MRIAGAIACLSLLIPNVGSPGRSHESGRSAPTSYWDTPALLPYRHQAYGYVRKGQLVEAAKAYEQAFQEAMRLGDKHSAVRFMNNVGACRMRLLQMRKAMLALLLTRKIAEEIGFDQVVRASTLNLSELYLHMGDLEAAVQAADRGLEALKPSDLPAYRIQVLLLLGQIRSRRGDMAAAEKLYYDAIALAERSKETAALGLAWNNLGYEYMKQAEQAISRAHQILRDDPEAELCFPNLAHLYLIKGDLGQSSKWMDLGVKAYVGGSKELPGWHVYQDRGKLRQAQGKHTLAFEDFRRALNSARLWRLDVVPASSLRVSSEVKLQNIYDSFLTSGYQVYRSLPSQKLMAELFLVSEENRAWSLRQTLREATDSKLPDEYFELLAQMRSADSRMLNAEASKDGDKTFASLRHRMTEMEAAAGLELPSGHDERVALDSIQSQLRPDEALLSFHLSGETSLLWTVTHDRLTMHLLPQKSAIEAVVSRLRKAVSQGSPEVDSAAEHAYQTLLGDLPIEVMSKRHWLLALDVGLFDLPFAALRSGKSYLIEEHALTLTLHSSLRARLGARLVAQAFLGFGDPVYNKSDIRWQGPRQMFGSLWASREVFELPRLPGTGREIDRCGRLVDSAPVLIKGKEATAERLISELRRNPAIIHLATHVIQSKADPGQALIALSLGSDGVSSVLSRNSIAALRTNAAVVTMSGCSSGLGPSLPGEGLMGLTRAWLDAGAHSVAASLWPVTDDSGELFSSFYRALRSQETSASYAMQTAQLESLRSGSWRSNPRYWAAYFIAGKD